jgi:hypothetical protein
MGRWIVRVFEKLKCWFVNLEIGSTTVTVENLNIRVDGSKRDLARALAVMIGVIEHQDVKTVKHGIHMWARANRNVGSFLDAQLQKNHLLQKRRKRYE